MKTLLLVALFVCAPAFAQLSSGSMAELEPKGDAPAVAAPSAATAPALSATPMNTSTSQQSYGLVQKLHERFRVTYFGELYGPNAKKWDDNQYDRDGNKMRDPMSMWQSFNVLTKVYDRTSFFMSPRVYTVIGDRNDLKDNQDKHVITMDDWQFGFNQNWVKTEKTTWDSRLTHRAPMSVASRNDRIDSQMELLQVVTWKPIPQVFVLSQSNVRYYVYENQVEDERYRLNQMTAVNWIFNDYWRIQLFNEFDMQHRNPKDGPGSKDWNYFKKYKDIIAMGVGFNPTHHLTIMPFVKALNDTNIRPETMQIGLWAFGTVF